MTLFPSLRRIRSAPVAVHRLHSLFASERRLIGQSKGTVQQRARTQNRINLLSFLRPVKSAPVALHRLRTLLEYEGQTRLEGTLTSMQSDAAQWGSGEPTARTTIRPRGSRIEWQPRARDPVLGRAPALFLIAFCAGVVATLAWQSYEAVPAVPSPDQEVLKAISFDLIGVRHQLDEIATQLTVGQEQMTRDITRRLEAAEKDVLDKIGSALPPRPTAAPARSAH